MLARLGEAADSRVKVYRAEDLKVPTSSAAVVVVEEEPCERMPLVVGLCWLSLRAMAPWLDQVRGGRAR